MKKLFFFAAAICTVLTSCSKDENLIPAPDAQMKTPINLAINQDTRANDSSFAANDKVGVYVVNYNDQFPGTLKASGNYVDNMQFTYNAGAWTPATPIYWLDKTTNADLYAYYPYSTSASTTAHSFSVKADQSTEANYWASDFLWGKATSAPTKDAVAITTNHVFSNILLYLQPGEGFTASTFAAAEKSVKINNVKTEATINLATGVATATGDSNTIIPWDTQNGYYRAMVIPQTIAAGTELITITINGVDYVLKSNATFAANKQHKVTVTVNRTSNGVNIGIGGWETGDEYGGDAE